MRNAGTKYGYCLTVALCSAAFAAQGAVEPSTAADRVKVRKLYLSDYRDKMAGAWLGQMVGVEFGQPTEGRKKGALWSFDELPVWRPEMVNGAFENDDLFVEANFIRTLESRGIDVDARAAGIDFANMPSNLYGANFYGLNNLRKGIAPPACGHPKHHRSPDALDYQIESDFSGIVAPGLPQRAIMLGEQFGRLVSHGDGLYAGQFIGAMYSAAFFEPSRAKAFDPSRVRVVEEALKAIPAECKYAQMVRDVLEWYKWTYRRWNVSWHDAWKRAVEKYGDQKSPHFGNSETVHMEVKLNGAMVIIGYLWGEGDIEQTMKIATACGFDSDCNPSSALGVLGCQLGAKAFDAKYTSALDPTIEYSCSGYCWHGLLEACERIARQIVVAEGGSIGRDGRGDYFLIPEKTPVPSPFADSLKPAECKDLRYTDEEMSQIRYKPVAKMKDPVVSK